MGTCGVSPEYFRHKMTLQEAGALIRGYQHRQHIEYDQARLVARVVAACFCKELPEDFLQFPWEQPQEEVKTPEQEAQELKELMEQVPKIEELVRNQIAHGQ